jgi:hypothetical protein
MSVSVVDQLVERCLSSEQNQAEIAGYDELPVKPGMGFSKEKIDSMGVYFEKFDELVSSDVSGWDWSVSGDELRFDAERRRVAHGVASDSALARALVNRALCLSRAVISFSDGVMLSQRFDGVQKSGSYNTSSGNSWIRVAAARYAGAGMVAAMGDDCVDDGTDRKVMAVLGHDLKESVIIDANDPSWLEEVKLYPSEIGGDVRSLLERFSWQPYDKSLVPTVDFCSHWWLRSLSGKIEAVAYRGWRKSLMNLVRQRRDRLAHFAEFVALMAHSPAMPYCVGMLLDRGWFSDPQSL